MSVDRYTFDTNILFYALDPNAPEKHSLAKQIVRPNAGRAVLLLQSLGELCNAIRKKQPERIANAHLWMERGLRLFEVVAAQPSDLIEAIRVERNHHLPFWDAMLWATAQRTNCTLLLSEDFNDGQQLGSVLIRNPFTMSTADLEQLVGS